MHKKSNRKSRCLIQFEYHAHVDAGGSSPDGQMIRRTFPANFRSHFISDSSGGTKPAVRGSRQFGVRAERTESAMIVIRKVVAGRTRLTRRHVARQRLKARWTSDLLRLAELSHDGADDGGAAHGQHQAPHPRLLVEGRLESRRPRWRRFHLDRPRLNANFHLETGRVRSRDRRLHRGNDGRIHGRQRPI